MTQFPPETDVQALDPNHPKTFVEVPAEMAVQRVMASPIYLLLRGDAHVRLLIEADRLPLPLLAAVDETNWLNLMVPEYIQALMADNMTIAHILAKKPLWQLSEQHYEALRTPDIRRLIHEGIFSFDRYMRLNTKQLNALKVSAGLRAELFKRNITAPHFLRHSPSQLAELVSTLDVPSAAL